MVRPRFSKASRPLAIRVLSCGAEANDKKEEKKSSAAILIAASLIAAVRLHREEIKPSPSVHCKIADSIRLAEMIQAKLQS